MNEMSACYTVLCESVMNWECVMLYSDMLIRNEWECAYAMQLYGYQRWTWWIKMSLCYEWYGYPRWTWWMKTSLCYAVIWLSEMNMMNENVAMLCSGMFIRDEWYCGYGIQW